MNVYRNLIGGKAHIPFGGVKLIGIGARIRLDRAGFLHGTESRLRRLYGTQA